MWPENMVTFRGSVSRTQLEKYIFLFMTKHLSKKKLKNQIKRNNITNKKNLNKTFSNERECELSDVEIEEFRMKLKENSINAKMVISYLYFRQ